MPYLLAELNVRESLLHCMMKTQWKSLIKSRILAKNSQDVLEMCRKYKKVDYFQLKEEDFELKDFFRTLSLSESRMIFKIKTNMVKAKMNTMSDPLFPNQL